MHFARATSVRLPNRAPSAYASSDTGKDNDLVEGVLARGGNRNRLTQEPISICSSWFKVLEKVRLTGLRGQDLFKDVPRRN